MAILGRIKGVYLGLIKSCVDYDRNLSFTEFQKIKKFSNMIMIGMNLIPNFESQERTTNMETHLKGRSMLHLKCKILDTIHYKSVFLKLKRHDEECRKYNYF